MTATELDLLFTLAACAFEVVCCVGGAWLLGIPQRAGAGLSEGLRAARRAWVVARWRQRRRSLRTVAALPVRRAA